MTDKRFDPDLSYDEKTGQTMPYHARNPLIGIVCCEEPPPVEKEQLTGAGVIPALGDNVEDSFFVDLGMDAGKLYLFDVRADGFLGLITSHRDGSGVQITVQNNIGTPTATQPVTVIAVEQ